MTAAAAKKQRGFTLVELMIVLAVIGLILGGSLLTLGIQIRDGGRLDEQNQLERIREAVFAYALRHNTEFRYLQSVASPLLNYEIPAGRPYLPCPDIDGDGLEDRLPVDILRGTSPISTSATDPSRPLTSLELIQQGGCMEYGGVLPWATLGVPPSDQWGNRYTYRVDLAFANSILGFGPETRADEFETRVPLCPADDASLIAAVPVCSTGGTSTAEMYQARATRLTMDFPPTPAPFQDVPAANIDSSCGSGTIQIRSRDPGVIRWRQEGSPFNPLDMSPVMYTCPPGGGVQIRARINPFSGNIRDYCIVGAGIGPCTSTGAVNFNQRIDIGLASNDYGELQLIGITPPPLFVIFYRQPATPDFRAVGDLIEPPIICHQDCGRINLDTGPRAIAAGSVINNICGGRRGGGSPRGPCAIVLPPPKVNVEGDVTDGIPFAVISHGQNGFGAINHISSIAAGEPRCNAPTDPGSDDSFRRLERYNAIAARVADTFRFDTANCGANEYTVSGGAANDDANRNRQDTGGVSSRERGRIGYLPLPTGSEAIDPGDGFKSQGIYDDLVIWMTRVELSERLYQARGFAAQPLPVYR